MLFLLFLIFPIAAQGQFPSDVFPTCLRGNLTWDISGVSDIAVNVLSPEFAKRFAQRSKAVWP